MSTTTPERRPNIAKTLPAAATEILASIAQHRVLTTRQINALHTPHATHTWTRYLLSELRDGGVITGIRAGHQLLWFATPDGHDALDTAPRVDPRRRVITPQMAAAGTLRAHTTALNDAAIAFVTAAHNSLSDECGPFAWRHEIAHPLTATAEKAPGTARRGASMVIADAILRYARYHTNGEIELLTWFLELDRSTMGLDDIADKLRRYARLTHYTSPEAKQPAWRRHYPDSLPTVLFILTGGRNRAALERRRSAILALATHDHEISNAHEHLHIRACLLEDLTNPDGGPWAPIWIDSRDPTQYVNAAGEAVPRGTRGEPA